VTVYNQWSKETLAERFARKWVACDSTGCHIWIGNKKDSGYGQMVYKGRRTLAHRIAMMLEGHSVEGFYVLHKCHNRLCVNPAHLYLGDHNQNMRDMAEAGSKKGELHHNCELTDSDLRQMFIKRYQEGRTVEDIAKIFGVSKKHTSALLNARKRSHTTRVLLSKYRSKAA